jgi:hypothetical protein
VAEVSEARWHALSRILDHIAPLAEAAQNAATRAEPAERPYAQEYAATWDSVREWLVKAARQAAPKDTP